MSAPPLSASELVDRLDARHEELIEKLDALNARIEATLADLFRSRAKNEPDRESTKAA